MADLTYHSPIKFDFSPNPKSTTIFEFRLKGSNKVIKINVDINIFYKDPYISGRVFLLNSGEKSVYTSTEDRVHTLKFSIPEFQNRTQSHIYMSMEPIGDPYQKVIIEDVKITSEDAPPPVIASAQGAMAVPNISIGPKIGDTPLNTTAITQIQPRPPIIEPQKPKLKLKDQSGNLNIICEGPMFGNSGFAKAMKNIAFGLDKIGCNVKTIVHDADNADYVYTEEGRRVNELISNSVEEPCIWITMTHPGGVQSHIDHYSIGYVMFETEEFPDNFVQNLKKQNEIWTPSNFCRNSMIRSGLERVFAMPLGVDTELFHPGRVDISRRISDELTDLSGKYRFLSVMGYSMRKGVDILVRAFAEEFDGDKDVILYLKGGWYDLGKAKSEIKDIIKDIQYPPSIHLDFNIYSDDILATLYRACDCFILPTRGEGWGLPLIEAMSMEMPVIATRWSGHLDFMNDDNSYLIDIEGLGPEPRCNWITPEYSGRNFAIPSKDHLRKLMRHVYEYREAAKYKGKLARTYILENFTWEKCCKKIVERLNNIYESKKDNNVVI